MIEKLKFFWERWKQNFSLNVVSSLVFTFFLLPLAVLARDKLFGRLILTPDTSLSVYACAPLASVQGWIVDSKGNKYPVPDALYPSPFEIIIRNDGAKYLDDTEFLVLFKSTNQRMQIEQMIVGTRSPLDHASYSASMEGKTLRLSSKRMNPNDIIYVSGIADAPITMQVFSRSVGLSTTDARVPGCDMFKPEVGPVYVFYKQAKAEPKKSDGAESKP